MDIKKLAVKYKNWNESSDQFYSIISGSLGFLSLQSALAREFCLDNSSIKRWADGVAEPLPRFRKLVIAFIQKYSEDASKSETL